MTATSLEALRVVEPSRRIADEKMEQVRELLLGEDLRRTDVRLEAIESRLRALETDVARRIDAMQARLEAMSGEVSGERRAAFDELAKGISDLGQRIKTISRI
ncbi:MAG: hypothetical protein APF80_03845 [Alphaproteobacteria bacterium BRH_c36]|nr:MAG: hypothetical protein APF80_03845 [Alphaproteobacteria bacterium BRH_c36]